MVFENTKSYLLFRTNFLCFLISSTEKNNSYILVLMDVSWHKSQKAHNRAFELNGSSMASHVLLNNSQIEK